MTTTPTSTDARGGAAWGVFAAAATVVAALLVAVIRGRPPAPEPLDAPADRFSAMRAYGELRTLLRDVGPHPVGSPANTMVRDRIVARLADLGCDPKVKRHWSVVPSYRTCAFVENVVARVPGQARGGPAVVLAAHYDSVQAGPGAHDDGAGVAVILEVARMLREGPPRRLDVVLLVTDGEEAGLLGARAHVRAHGTDGVAAVVNLEARGTSGPALMFQTGDAQGGDPALARWAAAARRPMASSLYPPIYELLPNDTDFTVFRDAGVPGLNFANVGAVQHYHTPLDALANVDPATLQHLGDQAWAAVSALADAPAEDLARGAPPEAWFDVLGAFVVRMPLGSVPLRAGLLAAALLAAVVVWTRRAGVRAAQVGWGLAAALAAPALAGGLLFATGAALARTDGLATMFVAHPSGALTAAAGAAFLGVALVAWAAGRRAGAGGAFAGTWTVQSVALAAAGAVAPVAIQLALVPCAIVLLPTAWSALTRRTDPRVVAGFGLAAAAITWFPLVLLVADGVGVGPIPNLGLPLVPAGAGFVLVAAAALPLLAGAGRTAVAASLAVLVAGAALVVVRPTATPERPRPVTFAYVHDETRHHAHVFARTLAGPLPDALRAAGTFEGEKERLVPWAPEFAWAAAAPDVEVPGPVVDDLRVRDLDGARRITFRLRSARGAPTTLLAMNRETRLRRLVVGGTTVPPETLRTPLGYVLACRSTPPDGVEFILDVVGTAPVDAFVADLAPGLPDEVGALARARPPECVPFGTGDETIVHRRVKL